MTARPLPALRPPFASLQRQRLAASFGMWLFLGSEALLFAGLIAVFLSLRFLHTEPFLAAGRETGILYGTVNTVILLASSLTMAIGAEAARARLRRACLVGLAFTLALGLAFLAVKGLEYRDDLARHLLPGPNFPLPDPAAQLFFGFYWIATGLHALHLTGGMVGVAWLLWQAWRRERPLASPAFEAMALYWHLVDIVWVILFPLLYLGGRAG
jgi:cytochrome c oxidase subunit 3